MSASLSDNGKLHCCKNVSLVPILGAQVIKLDSEPEADGIIIDGSALHCMPPCSTNIFDDYARDDRVPK